MANTSSIFYKIKRTVVDFVANIRIYWFGFILFGDSHYKVKGTHTRQIMSILEPGDILLRTYYNYLGSKLTPGYWSHAALYEGDDKVIHMLGEGITREDILIFTRCDDVAVLRHPDKKEVEKALVKLHSYYAADIEYDYDFNFHNEKEMSCTELVSECYSDPVYKNRYSENIILPDDLLDSVFDIVWKKN